MQRTIDTTVAAGTMSSLVWLQYLDILGQGILFVGGAVLLALRIGIAWLEFREKRRKLK